MGPWLEGRLGEDVINNEQKATLSTNDIVINKLTQILSYLRAGNRTKKKNKDRMGDILGVEEDAGKAHPGAGGKDMDLPIYDDVGDYKSKKDIRVDDKRDRRGDRRDKDRDRGRDEDRRRDDKRDRNRDSKRHREGRDRDRERWDRGDERNKKELDGGSEKHNYFDKHEEPREKEHRGFSAEDKVGRGVVY